MRDFFPTIGTPTVRRTRKPVTDQFPTVLYTDPECLQIIKECDKDQNSVPKLNCLVLNSLQEPLKHENLIYLCRFSFNILNIS